MKRVKLTIAYDGSAYCGWQKQINGLAVEEVINNALSDLLGEKIEVIGASRTDSGVHAYGNVAVFDTESKIPSEKICFALNQRLPDDITIQKSEEVPLTFHPRFCNSVKTYEYKILNRKIDMPIWRLYSHFVYMPLDVEKMRRAAEYIIGEHDFKSFCSARTQVVDTVRTIYSLDINKDEATDMITIRISGNGFLYNMVRIIAGTLIKVGLSVYPPQHVKEIIESCDRNMAGPKAPAKGLSLVGIEYEEDRTIENTDSIIFDIDGTLWDVRKEICEAWSEAIRTQTDLPVNFDMESLGSLFGKTMDEIADILYPDLDKEKKDMLFKILCEKEHEYIREKKPAAYAGTRETLEKLSQSYPLYIVTNGQKGYVELMLEATGLGEYFEGWLCFGDTKQPKNVTLSTLIEKYNLKNPVYIGDTYGDAVQCKKANVPFVYAAYGLGEVKKPKYIIRDITNLTDIF